MDASFSGLPLWLPMSPGDVLADPLDLMLPESQVQVGGKGLLILSIVLDNRAVTALKRLPYAYSYRGSYKAAG